MFWLIRVRYGTEGERARERFDIMCVTKGGGILWYDTELECWDGDEMMEKYTLENGEYRLMEILNGIIWEK